MKKTTTAPRAAQVERGVTPLIQEFCDWIASETGYKPDPLSVMLGSSLRATFQAERRAEKQALLDNITVPKAKPRRRRAAAPAVVVTEAPAADLAVSA